MGQSSSAKFCTIERWLLRVALGLMLAQASLAQSSGAAAMAAESSPTQSGTPVQSSASIQSAPSSPPSPAVSSGDPSTESARPSVPADALEREFFAAIRDADTRKFLSYVPDAGINYGKQVQHLSRAEVEDQLLHRRGLYCQLFDSSCIGGKIELDASAPACSDRELLTHSEKVRTAATETVRNKVRQAILVAEVKNQQCPRQLLIDFVFNLEDGQWKLFSVP